MTRTSSDVGWAARPCMVLGYDRSEGSRHAARWAARELAGGGKLVIVYACRGQHMPPSPLSTAGERHDEGRAILDELLLDGDEALFDIDLETHLSDQDPATALIDAARRHDARAIVLGSKPHSRLHEALGTVTTEAAAEFAGAGDHGALERAGRRPCAHAVRRRRVSAPSASAISVAPTITAMSSAIRPPSEPGWVAAPARRRRWSAAARLRCRRARWPSRAGSRTARTATVGGR